MEATNGPLFLTGYMASGKTTLGQALAKRLNKRFIDLDQYIEEKTGMSISETFRVQGEEAFREIEKLALHEVAEFPEAIIACGGGTPCFFDNMEFMNQRGLTVFLDCSISVIVRRLLEENSRRPLVAGKSPAEMEATILAQLERRMPFYSRAKASFCSDCLESEQEIENSVEKFMEKFPLVFSNPFL